MLHLRPAKSKNLKHLFVDVAKIVEHVVMFIFAIHARAMPLNYCHDSCHQCCCPCCFTIQNIRELNLIRAESQIPDDNKGDVTVVVGGGPAQNPYPPQGTYPPPPSAYPNQI